MRIAPDVALWKDILQADEENDAYFAARAELPGVVLFTSERDDAPEFDVAVIRRVPDADADAALRAVIDHFRTRGRRPRVRLTPLSTPADWPGRLRRAGFIETPERLVYFAIPETARLAASAAVRIERAVSSDDADRFSAIQSVGFGLGAAHRQWDRELARRHLAEGRHVFYLAFLDGRPVGAARRITRAGGPTALAALATLPEARRRGVGTSLLRRMTDDARSDGSATIFGAVVPDSYAASLYDRLGFVHLFATRTFAGV